MLCVAACSLLVSFATVLLDLAAVRHFHITTGAADPLAGRPRLDLIFRGMRRTLGDRQGKARLRITAEVLARLTAAIQADSVLLPPDTAMLTVAFTSAFFGFLRVSEFTTAQSSFADSHTVFFGRDISLTSTSLRLYIKSSKTNPFRNGNRVVIGNCPAPISAVKTMRKYTRCLPLSPNQPAFHGVPVSRFFDWTWPHRLVVCWAFPVACTVLTAFALAPLLLQRPLESGPA